LSKIDSKKKSRLKVEYTMKIHIFDAIAQDPSQESFTIVLFGSTPEGEAVRLHVEGFEPYFYVELPNIRNAMTIFRKNLETELGKTKLVEDEDYSLKKTTKNSLYGYSGGKSISLVRISVKKRRHFYTFRNIFLDEQCQPKFLFSKGEPPMKVYDAMLDPMLRWFHIRDIQPCGWIYIDCELEEEDGTLVGSCNWDEVNPTKGPTASAPFKTVFWDIECYSASGDFPMAAKGDPIIQIGNVVTQQGKETKKIIFVLKECDPIPGITVKWYNTEKEMLIAWAKYIKEINPDIFVGYNIFGFDDRYVVDRAKLLGLCDKDGNFIEESFVQFNRLGTQEEYNQKMRQVEKFLSSSALGDNYLYMWNSTGRLEIDLYHYIRRNANLPSYKLDSVAEFYLSGKLSAVDKKSNQQWIIKTKQTGDVSPGRYVTILDETGEAMTEKMKVLSVESGKSVTVEPNECDFEEDFAEAVKWAVVKDDVPPAEIFRLHNEGGPAGNAIVAKYCIQDCDLVNELYKKLDVFNNAMSMANVCSVPVKYIFTRGQGIKIESLIFKECRERDIVIEVLKSKAFVKEEEEEEEEEEEIEEKPKEEVVVEDSYEGAIVLDPVPGFYSESPIGVCDFASLYPSTIISENISHDSLVWVKDFDLDGKLVCVSFGSVADEAKAPEGTRWTDIEFDIKRPDPNDKRKQPEKIKVGTRLCRYAQKPDGTKHTLPDIVAKLLKARKDKRKEAEKETDIFRKALLDAEQLAYKLTANSLYGQLGSATFKIRLQHLAASVTAYGRKQILFAKAAIEKFYGPEAKDPRCSARVIYGDTDSLFVDFGVKNVETGLPLLGTEAVEATMHITEEAGKFVSSALKPPHDFEYDKVFDQFIIFSKKRYVGNKYEESATDFKQTSMGIVLKRRDNAPILKTIYGGAIKILLNERDIQKAVDFVKSKTMEMIEGNTSLSQLTITKSLSKYKADWIKDDIKKLEKEIAEKEAKKSDTAKLTMLLAKKKYELTNAPPYPAHKILANRMAERDPGNAPAVGERMGYVYISPEQGKPVPELQGDRIEAVDFIKTNKLKPDYEYYILHQLMKPLGQLFGLMVERIQGCPYKSNIKEDLRESVAIDLLFSQALNACKKQGNLETFVQPKSVLRRSPRNLTPKEPSKSTATPLKQNTMDNYFAQQDPYFVHKVMVKEYEKGKKKESANLKEKKGKGNS
jgi:DNA polymerase elongation subunit (family B)